MRVSMIRVWFDYEALERRYVVVRVRSDGGSVRFDSRLFDAGQLFDLVESTAYIHGDGSAYLLLKRSNQTTRLVRELIRGTGDTSLSYELLRTLRSVADHVLLTLLLNGLARSPFETPRMSNIGGKLIIVQQKRTELKGDIIHGLSIGVDKDMCLSLKVCTFTKFVRFSKDLQKKYARLPRYALSNGVFMRRASGTHDDYAYVQRTLGNSRYTYDFLNIGNEAKFEASKLGVLENVLRRFCMRYGNMAQIEFEELHGSETRQPLAFIGKNSWRNRVAGLIQGPICVADETKEHDVAVHRIADGIEKAFGLACVIAESNTVTIPSSTDNACYIRLIYDDATYGEGPDPHDDDLGDALVQHVTVNSVVQHVGDGTFESVVDACMKELAIKAGVRDRVASLVDWDALGLGDPWTFGYKSSGGDVMTEYAFVEVHKGGSMRFFLEGDMHGIEHPELAEVLDSGDVDIVMRGPDGDVNTIVRRELFSLPGFEQMTEAFEAGDVTKGGSLHRGKPDKEGMLAGVLDAVFVCVDKRHGYYRIGGQSSSVSLRFSRAAVLREVRTVADSRLLFPDALRLLDTDFVRLRGATVVPFPIKYLREWLLLQDRH